MNKDAGGQEVQERERESRGGKLSLQHGHGCLPILGKMETMKSAVQRNMYSNILHHSHHPFRWEGLTGDATNKRCDPTGRLRGSPELVQSPTTSRPLFEQAMLKQNDRSEHAVSCLSSNTFGQKYANVSKADALTSFILAQRQFHEVSRSFMARP